MPNRRHVLTGFAALALAGAVPSPSLALETIDYTPESLAQLQQGGQPYLLDFFASWCTTCAAQERVLEDLASSSAAYGAIPILRVDWDLHSDGALARGLAIPRRSTLVLMRGTSELGRLVAETRRDRIAGLLDLAAA